MPSEYKLLDDADEFAKVRRIGRIAIRKTLKSSPQDLIVYDLVENEIPRYMITGYNDGEEFC